MSLFPYSSDARIESVLACTHCARSKAKCDRKVPCTRCVDRKLVCETRPPRRGHGHGHTRSNHSCNDLKKKRPRSRGHHGTRMSVGSDTDSAFTFAGESHFSTQALRQAEDSYMDMDWTLLGDSSGDLHVPALPDPPITASLSSGIYPLCPDEGPGCYALEDLPQGDFPFCAFPGMPSPTAYFPSLTDTDGSLSDLPYSLPTLTPAGASQDNILPLQAADIQPHEALDGWPIFKCNPIVPSRECTPTAAHHVNHLRTLLENCTEPIENSGLTESTSELAPLLATTRERLTAVLQGLFNEAQHVYSLRDLAIRTNTASRHSHPDFSAFGGSSILLLPPPLVLESLLQSCLAACSPYYPFITTASRTVSKRMESSRRPILPSIFLLLMLAAGAMTVGAGETHNQMAHGLVEICRISLRRQVEQDVQLALDPEVLECALLLTIVAVWSGDKWQMDISICQKAMFLEMHSQAGFQNRETQLARYKSAEDVAQCCQVWEENERKNRITYSWLILDHEICLSQDIPSTSYLSITNLDVPIPSGDITSGLKSTKRWMQGISHSSDHITLADQHDAPIPPPLSEYVRYFRETNDVRDIRHVSPTSLRLLLCYLQNTVAHLRCSVDRIPIPSKGERHRAVGQTSLVLLSVQFQEAQELLNKWYTLARTHFMSSSTDDCSPGSSPSPSMPDSDSRASSANMILYHLVMLNTMVSFPEIERMARIEPGSRIAKPGPAPWKHPYHLENTRDIYVQCGQVLRLVRSTSEQSRPVWWAGAVYRVALVAWANSLDNTADTKSQTHGETVVLDDLPPDHPSILAYLDHRSELLPMLSDPSGALVSLHVPVDIIHHCARVLDSDTQTKFTMGIQQKMLNMAQRWGKAASRHASGC